MNIQEAEAYCYTIVHLLPGRGRRAGGEWQNGAYHEYADHYVDSWAG
jgi:hypothetical protein